MLSSLLLLWWRSFSYSTADDRGSPSFAVCGQPNATGDVYVLCATHGERAIRDRDEWAFVKLAEFEQIKKSISDVDNLNGDNKTSRTCLIWLVCLSRSVHFSFFFLLKNESHTNSHSNAINNIYSLNTSLYNKKNSHWQMNNLLLLFFNNIKAGRDFCAFALNGASSSISYRSRNTTTTRKKKTINVFFIVRKISLLRFSYYYIIRKKEKT